MNRLTLLLALVGIATVFGCSSQKSGGCGCGGGGGGGGGGCGCKLNSSLPFYYQSSLLQARGVLKLDGDSPVDEDFGEIFGLDMWKSPKIPSNVSIAQAHDPNFLFKSCCAGRGLSAACSARCNYDVYNQDLLQKMLIGADECPLDSLPEMHFCAAQGRDHSTCCRAQGVDATVAGDKCLVFCDQVPDKLTPIDYTYAACFGKFDEMKMCFRSTVASKAKAYFQNY
ncbi:hypothetical protein PRIPAC_80242 [Pristionchus pacificus]|uniref:DB domain-containing protein n=1 Tax=Pristionchus pacificus TaxID=54126 RepID=A0A454Y777_PRIPA|nr:hypothetical protein PRIPAC_80242 [Pristionchus pacificus]|eukprot:PDM72662.1 hypothetical protein PRIPAC_39096 [Pristionchus pacificus]